MKDDANSMIVEHLQQLSAYEFILKIIIIFVAMSVGIGLAYKTWKLLEHYRKAVNLFEEKKELLKKHDYAIQQLKKVDSSLSNEMKAIDAKVDNITNKLDNMQEKNDSRERARIKSRISVLYRHFHEAQAWNSMEKEAMEELIASYEECGGENSFIHVVVQQEMYTWQIVDE